MFCDKCNYKSTPYVSFGDPTTRVMVVVGSNCDSPNDTLFDTLNKVSDKINLPIDFYFSSCIKCKIEKTPSKTLIQKCSSLIKEEIATIQPKYILVVGETAFKALLWDFNLITRRKPEMNQAAGSHVLKDDIVYFVVHSITTIEKNLTKKHEFNKHIETFIKLVNGKIKIKSTNYNIVESESDLIYIEEEAKNTGRVAIDIETDPDTPFLPNSEILTVSFTVKDGESYCLPLSWPTQNYFKKWGYTPKINTFLAVTWLKRLLRNPNITKILHGGVYDMTWLETIFNVSVINYEDTMVMKYLLNQDDKERKGLKPLTKQYLDLGYYEYALKQYVGEGEPYSNIPPNVLMEYNNYDTDATLRLWYILRDKIEKLSLQEVYYDFLLPKLKNIVKLHKNGIALDTNRSINIKRENEDRLVELFSELKSLPQVANFERITGLEFLPSSTKHKLAMVYGGELTTNEEVPREIKNGKKVGKKIFKKVFFNGFNLTPILVPQKSTVTGKKENRKSFGKKAVQKYLKDVYKDIEYLDPINTFNLDSLPSNTDIMRFIKIISEIGSIQTQLSNHIEPFINHWGNTVDKCVHTSFDITGTTTGRLASRNPNLHNLKRDGFVKEVFVSRWSDEGILIEADYKQLELFIMAIVSKDPKFLYAFKNGIDLHTKTASSVVFKVPEAKVTKQMRTMAKTVNFGIIYGKTAYTLCEDLNVSEEKAQEILDAYFREYSGVKKYCDRIKYEARINGYVTTIMGRRRYLNYSDPNGADRQAVNTTIQSPASDVCLTAIALLQDYFEKLSNKNGVAVVCGTVHDSIIIDCKRNYINEIVESTKLIMENTGLPWLSIPLKVDIKYGPNLRHMEEWDGNEIKF